MRVLMNGWCVRWKMRRKLCGRFRLVLSVIIVVLLSVTEGQQYGSRISSSKVKPASNTYYGVDVISQSEHGSVDQFPLTGLTELLRNLTIDGGGQQQDEEKWKWNSPTYNYGGRQEEVEEEWKWNSPSYSSEGSRVMTGTQSLHGGSKVPASDAVVEDFNNKFENTQPAYATGNPVSNYLLENPSPGYTESELQLSEEPHPWAVEDGGGGYIKENLPIIGVLVAYLFVAILVYSAVIMPEGQCQASTPDGPQAIWKFRAGRRFVPAQSIDPHLQEKILELFSGDYDEHEDDEHDEFSHINKEHVDWAMDHVNRMCPQNAFFFSLSPRHLEATSSLKRLFLEQSSPEEVISLAKYLLVNEKVHPKVWYIALLGAKLDRQDMSGFNIAHPIDSIPDWYIPADLIWERRWGKSNGQSKSRVKRYTINRSRRRNTTSAIANQRKKVNGGGGHIYLKGTKKRIKLKQLQRPMQDHDNHQHHRKQKKNEKKWKKLKGEECITVDGRVGVDNGAENQLWYFREDMQLNQHHWYWHQVHPPNSTRHPDRRAELFFYLHRSFAARYNTERLSHGMSSVIPLDMSPGSVIYDGYNSHLADINSGVYWTPREPNVMVKDVFHDNDPDFAQNVTLRDYSRTVRRLVKAIKTGRMISANRHLIPINHPGGIEPLSNTMEASELSANPMFYDPTGIHNLGHILIGLVSDPEFRFRRVTGVMADGSTAVRDPAFYNFHKWIDNLFELHKQKLPPYRRVGGDFPLLWQGVEVLQVELRSRGGGPDRELRTFWTHHRFDLSPGVDGSLEKEAHGKVCAQHLDHEPFYFKIVINRKPCVNSMSSKATIRIFMAPRYDEEGKKLPLETQRRLMFPLDSFPVKLKVGQNTIIRHAEDSSLTQPWTKSLSELEKGPDPSGSAEFCGCGWPQHLYIPKGSPDGMAFDLFVMVTNYDEDHVENDPSQLKIPETCNSPYIFCGLPHRHYPDQRPMGYPFDRPFSKSLKCPPEWSILGGVCKAINAILYRPYRTLEQYVSKIPNMALLKFHIKHLDIFLPEPPRH